MSIGNVRCGARLLSTAEPSKDVVEASLHVVPVIAEGDKAKVPLRAVRLNRLKVLELPIRDDRFENKFYCPRGKKEVVYKPIREPVVSEKIRDIWGRGSVVTPAVHLAHFFISYVMTGQCSSELCLMVFLELVESFRWIEVASLVVVNDLIVCVAHQH